MKIGKIAFFLGTLLITINISLAQVLNPVKWDNSFKKNSDNTFDLVFKAKIQKGWHLYGLNIADGGPVRTSVNFKDKSSFELIGKTNSSKQPTKNYDSTFAMNVELFEATVSFTQKIKLKLPAAKIEGYVEFMVCDNSRCLPPTNNDFAFTLEDNSNSGSKDIKTNTPADRILTDNDEDSSDTNNISSLVIVSTNSENLTNHQNESEESLWLVFWRAFAKGILSVFTPCVFPIIPLIVAFFMRDNTTRKRIFQSILFGLTIVAFYTLTGLIAGLAKIDLTELSKYWVTNFIIFLLLFIVSLSFFGMFEIMLPGKLSNKLDQQVDKGGILAPFFLALATVVVSFSCVGPIAGLAIGSALQGEILRPVIAMLGFSLSFAFPFILIGIFPGLLKKLPKSGGWLNSVKVVFAFVVLASSMAFLSNLNLKFLTRDIALSIEIVIFIFLGLYLLGKIKFPHDSDLPFIKVPRLLLAILSFSMAVYLIPGLFGSPLKAISSFLPSQETTELNLNRLSTEVNSTENKLPALCDVAPKYSGKYHLPYNLPSYFDYKEGLACAKEKNKPVLLYFTGYTCKNCKNMYAEVWSDPKVLDKLRNDFIIISLFIDDFSELLVSDKYVSQQSGKEISTIGKKNLEHEIIRFGTNSQPLFVIMNSDEKILTKQESYAYSSNIDNFLTFLDEGIKNSK